jgi:hypothetical protein
VPRRAGQLCNFEQPRLSLKTRLASVMWVRIESGTSLIFKS